MALFLGELFGTIGLDSTEWDRKLEGAQGSLKTFGVAGAAVAATAAVAIGAAMSKGIVDSLDIEAGTDKLQASLGLTEPQAATAGRAAGSLFAQNYGESMADVNGAVEAVMSSIKGMRDASDADVEAMTAKMMNLSTVMEVDVARAAQVAGQMITSGIARDGVHAADLLTASLQKVPKNVREDILDAVDEYGPFMKNLGIVGEDAMGLLVTASEKGMYGIDKTGDAIKEFGIRATDMSKATSGAYEALGLGQEDMTAKLLAGGDTAKDAFGQIIHGLQEMEDPVMQSQAALALFGTPLEDLSLTEIPQFLGAMDPMGDKFDSVAGAADQMGKDLTSNAQSGFDGFVRQADAALIGFVQNNIMPSVSTFATFLNTEVGPAIAGIAGWIQNTALPGLKSFSDWFTENLPTIQNWATGIAFIMLPLFLRIAISAAVSAAAQVVAWATAAGGAVTTAAVYVAQAYIMVGRWVAMAAAAVVSGAITVAIWALYAVEAVKGAIVYGIQSAYVIGAWVAMSTAAIVSGIKTAAVWTAQVVASAVTSVVSFLVQTALVVGGWVSMAVAATVNAVVMAAGWVVGVVVPAATALVSFLVGVAGVVGGWLVMAAGAMANAAIMAAAWFIALGPIGWVIAAVIGLVALIIANWESVSTFTTQAFTNIMNFLAGVWRNIVNGVSALVATAVQLFLRFHPVGMIINNWSSITGWFAGVWSNITSGISGFISGAVSFFAGLPGKILGALGNMGSLLLGAGGQIIEGFLSGLKSGFESVKNFVGGIGDWIAKNKGPKAYDLALLVPAGGWIMTGLDKGLRAGIPGLKKTLGSVSATIQSGVTGGTVGLTGSGSALAGSSTDNRKSITYAPVFQAGPDFQEQERLARTRFMDTLNVYV